MGKKYVRVFSEIVALLWLSFDFFCTNSNCALEIITIARFILFISVSIERKSSYGIINTCTCMIEFKFVIKNIHVNKRLINKQLACCAWK